jgi:hypothetical protein
MRMPGKEKAGVRRTLLQAEEVICSERPENINGRTDNIAHFQTTLFDRSNYIRSYRAQNVKARILR